MRSITVDVDVDLSDYADEFFEDASDEDLIEQLKKRGLTVIGESKPTIPMGAQTQFSSPVDLKRHLCDIVDTGYCISNDELLDALKSKLH